MEEGHCSQEMEPQETQLVMPVTKDVNRVVLVGRNSISKTDIKNRFIKMKFYFQKEFKWWNQMGIDWRGICTSAFSDIERFMREMDRK